MYLNSKREFILENLFFKLCQTKNVYFVSLLFASHNFLCEAHQSYFNSAPLCCYLACVFTDKFNSKFKKFCFAQIFAQSFCYFSVK
ncbi:hypothetical protein EAG18_10140 [Pseudoalteromonas sp. J010]|nr:hypothetical protein EAG18_10140 [Pseudoalteromonas sp. J010]